MTCVIVDDDPVSRALLEHFVSRHTGLEMVASCGSAPEASNVLRSAQVDVVFLDVEMPEMTGIELVRNLTSVPEVVLVTSKEEYAVEAFEIDVTDYLLKPVGYARFLRAVERVSEKLRAEESAHTSDGDFVFIRTDGRLVNLDLKSVQYIEAKGDYVQVVSDKVQYMVHGTMKRIESRLPVADFIRVHRSYIVRIDRIKDVEDMTLVVGSKVVPIGASYKDIFRDRINPI